MLCFSFLILQQNTGIKLPRMQKWREMQTDQPFRISLHKTTISPGGLLVQTPDKEVISIARTTDAQNKLYYLYKIQDSQLLVSQLPLWLVYDKQYRLLSNGCLMQMKKLPEFSFHEDGGIVRIFVELSSSTSRTTFSGIV